MNRAFSIDEPIVCPICEQVVPQAGDERHRVERLADCGVPVYVVSSCGDLELPIPL